MVSFHFFTLCGSLEALAKATSLYVEPVVPMTSSHSPNIKMSISCDPSPVMMLLSPRNAAPSCRYSANIIIHHNVRTPIRSKVKLGFDTIDIRSNLLCTAKEHIGRKWMLSRSNVFSSHVNSDHKAILEMFFLPQSSV